MNYTLLMDMGVPEEPLFCVCSTDKAAAFANLHYLLMPFPGREIPMELRPIGRFSNSLKARKAGAKEIRDRGFGMPGWSCISRDGGGLWIAMAITPKELAETAGCA